VGSTPFGFYKTADFLKIPRDAEPWLIKPILPRGSWLNLFGKPKKARKSYLALGMAEAIANAKETWLGFDVREAGPVLFFQADTPHDLWAQRIADIQQGGQHDFSNVWFSSLQTMPYPFNIFEHEEILAEMIAAVPGGPVLIVFDTARTMHTGDENSSQDMTLFMHALKRVAGGMAKILITHDKKGGGHDSKDGDGDSSDLMEGNRGSTAIAGAMDTVVKMTPKGYMHYQGRAVGEMHKKLAFTKVPGGGEMGFMWEEDISDEVVEARALIDKYKGGSERSLARLLAKSQDIPEETARSVIRRQKELK
jgi:RecA-family ATPase